MDLVHAWGWKSFTIIYENNEGLVRLQELLKAHGPSEFPIAVRQLGEGSDYRYAYILTYNIDHNRCKLIIIIIPVGQQYCYYFIGLLLLLCSFCRMPTAVIFVGNDLKIVH